MARPYFTIGHSNRIIEDFIDLLRGAEVGLVADVRRLPGSRAYPQFDSDRLAHSLAEAQIGYEHLAELGGRRSKAAHRDPSPNTFWENRSFRNYADHALTDGFRSGLHRLRQLAESRTVAIMCAEAVWWRCHRRIIADYLLAGGEAVFHVLGPASIEAARLTEAATPRLDGALVYPSSAAAPDNSGEPR